MTRACCKCGALHMQRHAETVKCTVLSMVGKRLSLVRNPLQSITTGLVHPHLCLSRIDEALERIRLSQTQCPEPGEVYLVISTRSNCIGLLVWGAEPFSSVHGSQGFQTLVAFCRSTFLGIISGFCCQGQALWAMFNR